MGTLLKIVLFGLILFLSDSPVQADFMQAAKNLLLRGGTGSPSNAAPAAVAATQDDPTKPVDNEDVSPNWKFLLTVPTIPSHIPLRSVLLGKRDKCLPGEHLYVWRNHKRCVKGEFELIMEQGKDGKDQETDLNNILPAEASSEGPVPSPATRKNSTGVTNAMTNLRAKFLAMELIDSRCPSQVEQFAADHTSIFKLEGYVNFMVSGFKREDRRHLLENGADALEQYEGARRTKIRADGIWQALQYKDAQRESAATGNVAPLMDKHTWQSSACLIALGLVDRTCLEARDDKGMHETENWIDALGCKAVYQARAISANPFT